ncbi:hypothetical protein PG993_009113 [Apiospora rasikravindrae]|uniref:Uncharacterized protein n=1 Tax=Apiospora rasikravindrae TaxID=990691 RepID=A0ABR1SIJ2_9PEZI
MARRDIDGEWESIIGRIPIAHPIGKVAYDRWGISIFDHTYDSHVATYLPRPALTKTGRVAKKPQKQPYAYWKAQCAFRGLSPKGTIAQLQERLEGHETAPMLDEFKVLEEQAKKDFAAKNTQAVEDKWGGSMTDEQKISTDLRRYLTETFPAGATSPEAVVIQGVASSGQRWALGVQSLARGLGLMARIVEVTPDPDEVEVADRRWVVVGPKKPGMAKAAHPVLETTEEPNPERRQERGPTRNREETLAEPQEKSLSADIDECEDWDVTGTYQISCPYMEEQWGHVIEDQGLTLMVYRKSSAKGPQMYAKYDFGVTSGVFRFERHRKDIAKPVVPSQDDNKKRKRDQESDDEGTNEIQLLSDERPFEFKWYGPQVKKLKGTFGGDFLEDCSFTGVKIGVGADLEDFDIAEEWSSLKEHAHTPSGADMTAGFWPALSRITITMSGRTQQGRSVADHLEDYDERHYRQMDYAEARRNTGINVEAFMTSRSEQKAAQMNRLADEEYRIAEREKNDPLYRAARNGNKPSWGARIDAEILAEEQAMLRKKKAQALGLRA